MSRDARTNDLHTRAHRFAQKSWREPEVHYMPEVTTLIDELALEISQLRRDLDRLREAVHEEPRAASKGGPFG